MCSFMIPCIIIVCLYARIFQVLSQRARAKKQARKAANNMKQKQQQHTKGSKKEIRVQENALWRCSLPEVSRTPSGSPSLSTRKSEPAARPAPCIIVHDDSDASLPQSSNVSGTSTDALVLLRDNGVHLSVRHSLRRHTTDFGFGETAGLRPKGPKAAAKGRSLLVDAVSNASRLRQCSVTESLEEQFLDEQPQADGRRGEQQPQAAAKAVHASSRASWTLANLKSQLNKHVHSSKTHRRHGSSKDKKANKDKKATITIFVSSTPLS